MKKFLYNLFILIVCLFSFYSCSESPNNPNNVLGFDSARYNWKTYEIKNSGFSTINKIFAVDTNVMYLVNIGEGNILKVNYDGFQEIITITNFIPVTISGNSNSDIYFSGNKVINGNFYVSIYKWNGFTYEELNISDFKNYPGEFTQNSVIENNYLWVITTTKILKINLINKNLESFDRNDPNTSALKFYLYNGLPYYFSEDFIVFTDVKYRLYKFLDKNWNKELFYTYTSSNEKLIILNGLLVGALQNQIYRYENGSFVELFKSNNFNFYHTPDATSLDNFTTFGTSSENNCLLYNWNNIKWSKELHHLHLDISYVKYINPQLLYAVDQSLFGLQTYIHRGIKK
ncbi:MAG TPA: hypothetical protein VHP32_10285 [Ignavibacteria bacterium]|nr:hypothetical protein [Ignavibacteria bacterium]